MGIKGHGGDQYSQENSFENYYSPRDLEFLKDPTGYGITLAMIVMWSQHRKGGMTIQDIQDDE